MRSSTEGAMPAAAPSDAPLVAAFGLGVDRNHRRVLHTVDVEVRAGELVAVVGPNGAGKSTLLGALAGDLRADRGTVRLGGREVRAWSVQELSRRRAVLPQDTTVAFGFAVEDVVRMGRTPWRRTAGADADDDIVAAAMAATEIGHLAGRAVTGLSGGEKGRVALARALAQRAPLLMLDEPTAALDVRHQELALRVVRDHVAAGGGAVVVLHDLDLAVSHADRIVVLLDGRVALEGPPDVVADADALTAVYRHPVDVFPHPRDGSPVVLPRRAAIPGPTTPVRLPGGSS